MIRKILIIKNIGLFWDGVPAKMAIELDKATIIYAENGRGKSTFASILYACSYGDSGRIIARRTADSTGDPEIRLVVQQASGNSQISFQAGSWTGSYPEVIVFDSEFIDRNVYSGLEVRSDQRESLLEFALGDQAVLLKNHFEDLTHKMEEETRTRSDSEKKLSGYMAPYQLQEFIALQADEKIEEKIARKKEELADANHAKSILQRKPPLSISGLNFDLGVAAELLRSGLEDVADDTEATVRKHLKLHNADEFEAWLSRGQSFLNLADCPLCGQPLSGVDLISAYRSYFSKAYNDLKDRVAKLAETVETELGDGRLETINGAVRTNSAVIDSWRVQVAVDLPQIDLQQLRGDLIDIRTRIQALVAQKQDRPLEAIGTQEELEALSSKASGLDGQIATYNHCIAEIATRVETFKQQLSTANADTLKLELSQLEAVSRRYQPNVILLVTQYQHADQSRTQIDGERKTVRNNLDTIMSTTLEQYQARVNDLLASFNMQIRIEQLKPSHKGKGNPRTEYGLLVRNKSVKLGSRDDTSNTHSFGTTLSEADKRTLAFAFFVARLEQDPQLNSRVVVLDDPVSSLDRNRRNQSIKLIAELTTQCRQIIVLSHDAYFVRDLRDRLSTLHPQPITPVLFRIHHAKDDYSAFTSCDIDDICASTYIRHYRLVADYANGGSTTNPRDVAKAIRPLLEGYLHRRFPGSIPRRMMFGAIIDEARKATPPDPLVNLKKTLSDLRKINEYASEFHHDTNPDADTVVVNETELHSYAQSALNVIHKGG